MKAGPVPRAPPEPASLPQGPISFQCSSPPASLVPECPRGGGDTLNHPYIFNDPYSRAPAYEREQLLLCQDGREGGGGVSGAGPGHVGSVDLATIMRVFHYFNDWSLKQTIYTGEYTPGRVHSTPEPALFTPQLLHSRLSTHWAMAEQLAGQRTPQGPPEASRDKKGSSSIVHREWSGLGWAQGILSKGGKDPFLFFALHGPLTVVASPTAEHRLRTHRLSGHGSRPQPLCGCLLYTSPSPRDRTRSRMPSSA